MACQRVMHQLLDQVEPQARPPAAQARGKKWLECTRHHLGIHALAIVAHRQPDLGGIWHPLGFNVNGQRRGAAQRARHLHQGLGGGAEEDLTGLSDD